MGRTNVYIDDELIDKVISITGARSKREAIDVALRKIVDNESLGKDIKRLQGKLSWDGDLNQIRKSRV